MRKTLIKNRGKIMVRNRNNKQKNINEKIKNAKK
jgi:hypothetical protein